MELQTEPSEETPPTVFISYSHDDETHKSWVLRLATRLRDEGGVDVILDAWEVRLGTDLAQFMETGLSKSKRVICVCTDTYVTKANAKTGGAGYEKQIMTATMLRDLNNNWVIPVVRNNKLVPKLPTFLDGRLYIDFSDERTFEETYQKLLRDIHNEPLLPLPAIGRNPFRNITAFSQQHFTPTSARYVSPAREGRVSFNYSNNDGKYIVGQGLTMFEFKFSKANDGSIYIYNDPPSINTVAVAKEVKSLSEVKDARILDTSSRTRVVHVGQVAIIQNQNGYYCAIQITSIADDTRGAEADNITFDYVIQSNGSPDFTVKA